MTECPVLKRIVWFLLQHPKGMSLTVWLRCKEEGWAEASKRKVTRPYPFFCLVRGLGFHIKGHVTIHSTKGHWILESFKEAIC
jgi:hypothetical protein